MLSANSSADLLPQRPKTTPLLQSVPPLKSDIFVLLPLEILRKIITDPCISKVDLKAIRLVCPRFEPVAAELLFRQIVLSRCIQHANIPYYMRDTPRIARFVKELVWYELACDREVDQYFNDRKLAGDVCSALFGMFPTCLDAKLTFRSVGEGMFTDINRMQLHHFQDLLFNMFDVLPALHTFVSRPFPQDFVIRGDGYNFSACTLQTMLNCEGSNDGMFTFLLPAMMRPTSRIKRLVWVDEQGIPSLERLQTFHAPTFANLESVDLCIAHPVMKGSRVRASPDASLRCLGSCLQAARGLRELRLCFEKGVSDFTDCGSEWFLDNRQALKLILFDSVMSLPKLTSLSLAYARCCGEDLLPFLARHSASLRHLLLHSCVVTRQTIIGMRAIKKLHLESIEIVPSQDYLDQNDIIDDDEAASSDGSHIEVEEVSSCSILDFIDGKIQTCPITKDCLFSTISSRAKFGPQLPLTSMATFFDILEEDKYDYEPEDIDVALPIAEDYDMSKPEDADSDELGAEQLSELRNCRADYRQHRRIQTAPTWKWGRFRDNQIYYWPSTDGSGASTEIWKFTSNNERRSRFYTPGKDKNIAYGHEPLEFFPDWNSEDGTDLIGSAGVGELEESEDVEFDLGARLGNADVTEATPFGMALTTFKQKSSGASPIGDPPPGAVLYDSDDDPCA